VWGGHRDHDHWAGLAVSFAVSDTPCSGFCHVAFHHWLPEGVHTEPDTPASM
jgi:hypothetical protein